MATHDYIISNASGAAVRADLNNALAAIVSNNSNATSPATTYAFQFWADTTTGQLKIRNAANSAWITLMELDGTMLMEDGTVSAPGLAFASDTNTGFFRSAADKINFATGGAERLEIGSSEVVFNDPSNDVDFRVESNGNANMLFVDGGNDRVGIGFTAEQAPLEVQGENEFASSASTLATAATKAAFRVKGSTNSSDSLWMGVETVAAHPYIQGANGIGSSAKDLLLNPFGGNVGVATSSPNFPLDVNGNVGITEGQVLTWHDGSGNKAGDIYMDSSDNIVFRNTSSVNERLRITSSGKLVVGHSSATDVANVQSQLQVVGTDAATGSISIRRDQNVSSGPLLVFGKSRSGSKGGNTVVQADDTIGAVLFNAADGTDVATAAARIKAEIDGSPSSNDIPGRLVFETTADSSNSLTERFRIDQQGRLLINHTASVAPDGYESKLQLCDTSYQGSSLVLRRDQNNTSGGTLIFAKSRATSKGGNGLVSNGDDCGSIRWYANDGVDQNNEIARIRAIVNGTPGSDDTPGALTFWTTSDGSNTVTERMRVLAGGGLTFNGDTAQANALDDYEEGVFTPSVFGVTTNPSLSYIEQKGLYTKIGRVVYYHASIQWNARASAGSGNMQLALPFTANASHSFQGTHTTAYMSGLSSQAGFSSYHSANSNRIFVRDGTTNNTLLQCSAIGTAGHLIYGGFFIPA